MTPRERWDAAVRLQHEAVRDAEALPLNTEGQGRYCELINAATQELEDAYEPALCTSAEWRAAYSIHRESMLRTNRRIAVHRAELEVEYFVGDVQPLWSRIAPHC